MAEALATDVRLAVRALRRSPAFLAAALLSIGIGVGATTTIFTALDAFLFRAPAAVAGLLRVTPQTGRGEDRLATLDDLRAWRAATTRLALAGYDVRAFNLGTTDPGRFPERVVVARVTPAFFRVAGAAPALGAAIEGAPSSPSDARGVWIGHGMWQRRFGGRFDVLGEPVRLDGETFTIAGVLPADFVLPSRDVDVWMPLAATASGDTPLTVIGRLRAGGSIATAAAELSASDRWRATIGADADAGIRIGTVHEELVTDRLAQAGAIGMATAVFVLLIASANVSNLLLARGTARRREIALRRALGASRGRIVRQLVVEGALVASAGGLVGVLLAAWGVDGLMVLWSMIPDSRPFPEELAIGGRALGHALGAVVLVVLVAGVFPAVEASRAEPRGALSESGRAATAGPRARRLQRAFVVAQVALSLVLLVSAGLLARSFVGLQRADLGFDVERVLTFGIEPSAEEGERRREVFEGVLERVRALPFVEAAGAAGSLPLEGAGARRRYRLAATDGTADATLPVRVVTPGYHRALGIRLVRGRGLTEEDGASAARVAVINETLARRHWADRDPIGDVLIIEDVPHEIVGVAATTREWGPHTPGPAMAYVALAQSPPASAAFAVRLTSDAAVPARTMEEAVRAAVRDVHPELAVAGLRPMSASLVDNTARSLLLARVMSLFALVALVLAAVGVYGTMRYTVAQRVAEMGIRRALGATPRRVAAMVLGQGLRLSALGVVIGLVMALGATRALGGFLAGISATDPVSFGAAVCALVAAAVAACAVPAWRAARVEPMEALRGE